MFPIPFNFPFKKKDGSISTIGDEISEGGGGGGYTLPTASAETKGGVKIGSGLSMSGEVLNNINPTPYSLPTASDETLGGIKVGSGLSIEAGVLSATGGGGGTSIVSKTFSSINGQKVEFGTNTSIYYCEITNIDIDGYTPIGVIVNDDLQGYFIMAGLYSVTSGGVASHRVKIITSYAGSTATFINPVTVFYVPTSSITPQT